MPFGSIPVADLVLVTYILVKTDFFAFTYLYVLYDLLHDLNCGNLRFFFCRSIRQDMYTV